MTVSRRARSAYELSARNICEHFGCDCALLLTADGRAVWLCRVCGRVRELAACLPGERAMMKETGGSDGRD